MSRLIRDIDGALVPDPRGASHADYLVKKTEKLDAQLAKTVNSTPLQGISARFAAAAAAAAGAGTEAPPTLSGIFQDMVIYVTGSTDPPLSRLRELIGAGGGRHQFLTDDGADIVIANTLSKSRLDKLWKKRIPIVTPQWLVDSVAAGKLLSIEDYVAPCARDRPHSIPPPELRVAHPTQTLHTALSIEGLSPSMHTAATPSPLARTPLRPGSRSPVLPAAAARPRRLRMGGLTFVEADLPPLNEGGRAGEEAGEEAEAAPLHEQATELMHRLLCLGAPTLTTAGACDDAFNALLAGAPALTQLPPSQAELDLDMSLQLADDVSVLAPAPAAAPSPPPLLPRLMPPPAPPRLPHHSVGTAQRSGVHHVSQPGAGARSGDRSPSPPQAVRATPKTVDARDPGFTAQYQSESRLHLLSTAKQRIRARVAASVAAGRAGPAPVRGAYRTILHVDLDCFFAAVAAVRDPSLAGHPVAVTHARVASDASTADVASCNYMARAAGVRNGMWVGEARSRCPRLRTAPYDFDAYLAAGEVFADILTSVSAAVDPHSLDESFLDVTGQPHVRGKPVAPATEDDALAAGMRVAAQIRQTVRDRLGLAASVGVGVNVLCARFATVLAKPDGAAALRCSDVVSRLGGSPVTLIPGVGPAMAHTLEERLRVRTIGDLSRQQLPALAVVGAVQAEMLYMACRGQTLRTLTVPSTAGGAGLTKQLSVDVNWGVRFTADTELLTFLSSLASDLGARLAENGQAARRINIAIKLVRSEADFAAEKHLGHGNTISRNYHATSDRAVTAGIEVAALIVPVVAAALAAGLDVQEVRGIALTATNLVGKDSAKVLVQRTLVGAPAPRPAPRPSSPQAPTRMKPTRGLTEQDFAAAAAAGLDVGVLRELPPDVAFDIVQDAALHAAANGRAANFLVAPSSKHATLAAELAALAEMRAEGSQAEKLPAPWDKITGTLDTASREPGTVTASLLDAVSYLRAAARTPGAPPGVLAQLARVLGADRALVGDRAGAVAMQILALRMQPGCLEQEAHDV